MQLIEDSGKRSLITEIRRQIQSGELRLGEKLLSTQKLARGYGVSVQTAHRLLTELVNEGYLTREKGKGTFVTERRPLSRQAVVGMIMTCRGDIWSDFSATITEELQELGISTLRIEVSGDVRDCVRMKDHPATRKLIDASPLAVITYDAELGAALAAAAPQTLIICLSAERLLHFPGDIIGPDFYEAGLMATNHLIELGHTKIFFYKIKSPEKIINTKMRELVSLCDGYRDAIRRAGLQEDILVDATDGRNDFEEFCRRLQNPGEMDAAFINYDFRATQFVQEARKRGIRIPEDLAMVSALNTPWAESFELTSVDYGYDRIAHACVKRILAAAAGERGDECREILRFKPKLVIRKSCGATP